MLQMSTGAYGAPIRLHERFEWDDAKARANLAKHGVGFDDAATALADECADRYHLERHDVVHSGDEDRFFTLASDPQVRSIVYVIVWTEREDENGPVTRIISTRLATRAERRFYEQQVQW
jgi:uncharacterized DUF497 family protein